MGPGSVIYHEKHVVAFHKPAGVPSVPDQTGDESALDLAAAAVGAPLHPVHRLDRPTGGIVLMAATPEVAAALSALFAAGAVWRRYLAIVHGHPDPEASALEHLVELDRRTNRSRIVEGKAAHHSARDARLRYETVVRGERYSLVDVSLDTGRHHQIRVQLAAIGHPVRGDVKYGARRGLPGRQISLYATELHFAHPVTSEEVVLQVQPADDPLWAKLMPGGSGTETREA